MHWYSKSKLPLKHFVFVFSFQDDTITKNVRWGFLKNLLNLIKISCHSDYDCSQTMDARNFFGSNNGTSDSLYGEKIEMLFDYLYQIPMSEDEKKIIGDGMSLRLSLLEIASLLFRFSGPVSKHSNS